MKLKINAKFRDLLPSLTVDEYLALRSSIDEHGLRVPVDVWQGVIIDGHNRYEICKELDIEIKTKEIDFESETEAEIWIIQNNLARRNFNKGQYRIYTGRLYQAKKKAHGGDRKSEKSSCQSNRIIRKNSNAGGKRS